MKAIFVEKELFKLYIFFVKLNLPTHTDDSSIFL